MYSLPLTGATSGREHTASCCLPNIPQQMSLSGGDLPLGTALLKRVSFKAELQRFRTDEIIILHLTAHSAVLRTPQLFQMRIA